MIKYLLILLSVFAIQARASSYYITAVSGGSGTADGSSAANAADASTAAKYANIVNNVCTASGTTIYYASGTYEASGLSMFNHVTHQGNGIGNTIIQVASGSSMEYGVFQPNSGGSTISYWSIYDVTMDCNANNTGWWSSGSGASEPFAFSLADHCTIQRVKFINFGEKGTEAFLISFVNGNSANGNVNHNLIDSCVFTSPIASGNTAGTTCILMFDAQPNISVDTTNIVSNCTFTNLKYPTYTDSNWSNCVSAPVCENNTATNCDTLWYCEPGSSSMGNGSMYPGETCQVTGNTTTNCEVADIYMHPNGTFSNLNVQNNSVGMGVAYPYYGGQGPYGVVVRCYQSGNPNLGTFTVTGNTFTSPGSGSGVYTSTTSPNLFTIASLSVTNNAFDGFPNTDTFTNNTAIVDGSSTSYSQSGNAFNSVPPSTASPNDTQITTVGVPITDANGAEWEITSGGQVTLNSNVISYTANVIEIAYVSSVVWQENSAGNWYSFTSSGGLGAGPTTTPLPSNAPAPPPTLSTAGAVTPKAPLTISTVQQ